MKPILLGATLILAFWTVTTSVFAQEASTTSPAKKTTIEIQSFETKNPSRLGTKWAFLKDPHGPLPDAISNGLIQQLSRTLQDRSPIAVTGLGGETSEEKLVRGLPPVTSGNTSASEETPRFVVSCSATITGDTVTIEVRLTDPQTKQLISATKVEGTPEDLNQEIRSRFRDKSSSAATRPESPAEKAVRAAIIKAATWISGKTIDAVIVKSSMTRIKEAPSLQSSTLITVRQGTRLQKLGSEGEWIHVRIDSGELGWVYSEVVE
jgi:TolB-like protein